MKTKSKRILVAGLIVVVLAVVGSISCFLFFYRMVRVPTGSMANTIIPGDHLLVAREVFGESEISRGDLVVFDYPKNRSEKRIARVVGLPGESIELRGTAVYINGKELPEQRVTAMETAPREALNVLPAR
jgi:signal peptidase I